MHLSAGAALARPLGEDHTCRVFHSDDRARDHVLVTQAAKRTGGQSDLPGTFHAPFLARAANTSDERVTSRALGALLTMRLIDHIGRFGSQGASLESVQYNVTATAEFVAQLLPRTAEVNHLGEITRVAAGALPGGAIRILWPPMLAFAYWLEQEVRLEEALDVLDTVRRLSDGRAAEEEVATLLQRARVLRRLGRFDEATDGYAAAGALALEMADRRSELLSRIGRAIVLQKVGNLPESEELLRVVLKDAQSLADRDAEARASHDLAVALVLRDRPVEAAPYAFRAYELYEQPGPRARALSDTGWILKELGHYAAARDALLIVVESAPPTDILLRAELELLDLSAATQDQLSFERWRRELHRDHELMPSDMRLDFEIKLGRGLAAFGRASEAEDALQRAVALAERHGLGEGLFRAECALTELREHRTRPSDASMPPPAATPSPELQQTIDSVRTRRVSLRGVAAP